MVLGNRSNLSRYQYIAFNDVPTMMEAFPPWASLKHYQCTMLQQCVIQEANTPRHALYTQYTFSVRGRATPQGPRVHVGDLSHSK